MTTDNRKAQLGIEVDSTGAKRGFEEVKQGARDMARDVNQSGQAAAKGLDAIGNSGAQSGQKVTQSANSITDAIKRTGAAADQAAKSWGDFLKDRLGPAMREFQEQGLSRTEAHAAAVRRTAEEWRAYKAAAAAAATETAKSEQVATGADRATRSLINSIQRTTAAMQAGSQSSAEYYRALAGQRGASTAALEPYLRQLEEATRKQQQMAAGAGVSAAQTAAAMRSIPAQFTDIVTQLAGGGSPLLILTQQGGQLKDQFGGIGAAARGMGAYIVGLINPFTLLGGAATVLALAYKQGAAESDAYARALILTGNAAGVTATQLQANAKAISANVGTQGAAAEALTALTNTGAVAAQNMQSAGLAAVKMQRELGQSVGETAKQFAELSKTPLEATLKLNEQYRYLTISTYEQIKALQEQGRTADAATLAQETFAQAMNGRMNQLTAQLGYVERAARGVMDAAKGMWDALLDVGRQRSTGQAATAVAKQIALVQSQIAATSANVNESPNNSRVQRQQAELKVLQDQLTALGKRALLEDNVAVSAAAAAEKVEARARWDKEGAQYADKAAQMQREINKARNEGIAAGKTEKEIQERIAAIKEKFTDKGAASAARAAAKDQRDAELEGIKGLERQRVEAAKQAQDEIRVLRAKGAIDEREAIERTTQLDVAALTAKKASLDEQLAMMSKRKFSETEVARVQREAAEADAQIKTRMLRGEAELTLAIQRRAQAIRDVIAAQIQQQTDEELQGAVKAADVRGAARDRLFEERDLLQDQGQMQAAQLSMLGRSNQERQVAIEKLRIQQDLQRELQRLERMDGDTTFEQEQARRNAATRMAQVESKIYVDEWEKTADQAGQSLANALMEGGKSGWEYIKGLFRSQVLAPTIKAVIQPYVNGATQILSSSSAYGPSGGGGAGAFQTATGLASLYNTGANLYSAGLVGTQWAAGTMSAANAAGTIYGNAAGALYGDGLSALLATNGAYGTAAGATAGGTAAGGAAAGGSSGMGLATAAWWAAVALAVLNIFGAFRSKKVVGNGLVGTVGDGGDLDVFSLIRRGGTLLSGPSYSIQTADANPELVRGIQTAVTGMLDQARAQARVVGAGGNLASFTAPLGSDLIHPEVGRMGITLTGLTDEQARAKIEAEVTKLAEKMATQALGPAGEALAKSGETAVQTLQRLSGSLSAVNTALDAFNDNLLSASLTGADAASKLADLFGGIDQFTQSTQAYYQRYFSEAERAANSTKQLTKAFTELGLGALPASKQAYRDLVDAQDLTTESGRKAYASLLSLSGIFADLKDAVEQASESVQSEIQRLRGTSAGQSAASLQAQFAIKTAAARAGDASALSALPEITQALEKARTATATSAADVAFVRASLAASLSETLRALKVPGFAAGGMHAGGWRVVGERGPELEWTPPSRIFSNGQSQQLLSTERLEEKVAELTAKVGELQGQLLAAETQNIFYAKRTADLLMAVTRGGASLSVREGD